MTGRWICLWCCLWLSLAGACLPPAGKAPALGSLSFPNIDLLATVALTCELDGNNVEPCLYGGGRCSEAPTAFARSRLPTGQLLNEETSLHCHIAYYFDPQLALFIRPNPIISELADPLRFGSEAGRMWVEGGTPGQIALGAVQEGLRAAAIVPGVVLAAKFTGVMRSAATAESAATSAALGNTARGSSAAAAEGTRALQLPATRGIAPGVLGETLPNGQVFLRPGLSRAEQVSTLRHESVHAFFSPQGSGPVTTFRQNLGQWGYDNSQLLRFTEEAMAETYGSGSLLQGLRHPLVNGYGITPGGLLLEGGAVGCGIFGAGYLGYQMGGGN